MEDWSGEAAYLFVDLRFSNGARVPQIPRHQGSAQLVYRKGGSLACYAAQFEDDRNQFLLPGFATLQLAVQIRITKGFSALGAFENLLDREYLTGLSPTPTIGTPRLWRGGMRWEGRIF